jgi:hypothetical protein
MQRGRFLWGRAAAQQWGGLFFGVRSEDPLVGKCGVFFGVSSEAVAWQRHLHKIKRFLWGLLLGNDNRQVVFSLWSGCWSAAQWGGIFFGVRSEGI